jgi:hypothetical protein
MGASQSTAYQRLMWKWLIKDRTDDSYVYAAEWNCN